MMLSELRHELERLRADVEPGDAQLAELFLRRITAWRQDRTTPHQLLTDLDRTLGYAWFTRDETHTTVYRLLEAFRQTVDSLGGMTMNERLVMFDLMSVWDGAVPDGRQALYAKLEAKA